LTFCSYVDSHVTYGGNVLNIRSVIMTHIYFESLYPTINMHQIKLKIPAEIPVHPSLKSIVVAKLWQVMNRDD